MHTLVDYGRVLLSGWRVLSPHVITSEAFLLLLRLRSLWAWKEGAVVLAALPEDPALVPSTHIRQLTTVTSALGVWASSGLHSLQPSHGLSFPALHKLARAAQVCDLWGEAGGRRSGKRPSLATEQRLNSRSAWALICSLKQKSDNQCT